MCKKLHISFEWFDMVNSLRELWILNPQGLHSKHECLTYNNEGWYFTVKLCL